MLVEMQCLWQTKGEHVLKHFAAEKWKISRNEQDEFAFISQEKPVKAQKEE